MARRLPPRVPVLTAVLLAALAGCDAPQADVEPAVWSGDAFPQRQPDWTWPKRWALVTDSLSDTLTLVDRDALAVVAALPVGLIPFDIDGPHHAALDAQRNALYVPLSYPLLDGAIGPHNGHGLSLRDGALLRLDAKTLQAERTIALDPSPGDITVLQDGTVVVSHFDLEQAQEPGTTLQQRRGVLSVLSPAQIEAGKPPLRVRSCLLPHGMASQGAKVWVSCYGEDALAVVDVAAATPTAQIVPLAPVVGEPGQPLLGPYSAVPQPGGGALLAVGCRESRDLRLFSTTSATPVGAAIPLPGAGFFASWRGDGSELWAPSQGVDALTRVRAVDGEVLAQRLLGADCVRPHEVQLATSDGQERAWVVCEGDSRSPGWLVVLDRETLATVGRVPAGVYPDRLLVGGLP